MTIPACMCWVLDEDGEYYTLVPVLINKKDCSEYYGVWWNWFQRCPYCDRQAQDDD